MKNKHHVHFFFCEKLNILTLAKLFGAFEAKDNLSMRDENHSRARRRQLRPALTCSFHYMSERRICLVQVGFVFVARGVTKLHMPLQRDRIDTSHKQGQDMSVRQGQDGRTIRVDTQIIRRGHVVPCTIHLPLPGVINPSKGLTKALATVLHARHACWVMGHCQPISSRGSTSGSLIPHARLSAMEPGRVLEPFW